MDQKIIFWYQKNSANFWYKKSMHIMQRQMGL